MKNIHAKVSTEINGGKSIANMPEADTGCRAILNCNRMEMAALPAR